jgi:hypothetical protein
MKRHARKILAPALVTVAALAALAGAEPAGPKGDSLTIEGQADGTLVIRHISPEGKTLDLKIERQGDGRYRFGPGESGRIVCDRFRIAENGRMDFFGNVEMSGQGYSIKADDASFYSSEGGAIELRNPTEAKTSKAKP